MLFANWPFLVSRDLDVELDDDALFCNTYLWFSVFSKLYQARHGPDAGLERQAAELLEQAGIAIDFDGSIIEQIDERVRHEVASIRDGSLRTGMIPTDAAHDHDHVLASDGPGLPPAQEPGPATDV